MADPVVIQNIKLAAARTGADPAAMLATSLVENGARNALTPGDVASGHPSYGPFEMRSQVGALGNHPPSWALSPAAYLNRAQEFARLGVHGGKGAAAVQRPADPTGYALKVQGNLDEARRLLGGAAPQGGPSLKPQITAATTLQTNDSANLGNMILQSVLNQNAQIAGTPQVQLAAAPTVTAPTLPAARMPSPAQQAAKTLRPSGKGIYQKANWAGADQGVDYRGQGAVTALADAVVTRVQAKSSWIGAGGKGTGAIISYRITSGPHAGRNVYVAENITPRVQVGQRIRAGQPIAVAHGSFPYTESGWADPNGSPIGALGTSGTGRAFAQAFGLA